MHLTRLHIHHVRNLAEVALIPHSKFNILLGKNGSGKTSLLEAIYFLGVGRSFRSHHIQVVISHCQQTLACYGEVVDRHANKIAIGIEKNRQGDVKYKVAGESCDRLSVFAATLPLLLITPETFKLLQAGAEERRRYLDWGVFHVEPSFAELCQRYQRLIKQRNAALKTPGGHQILFAWEKELSAVGEEISACRKRYVASLLPFVAEACQYLIPDLEVLFRYEQGWPESVSLEQALSEALATDLRRGFTSVGPHRADLLLKYENFAAHQILSRGQQKLLISALYVAAAQQLHTLQHKRCVYLIDDLASELDQDNRERLLCRLAAEDHQVFLTGVDKQGWTEVSERFSGTMFHVEHGVVR